ncbi:hypothetical protein C8R42DRAFT_642144 [Lentinula raphanica]|nr:hypothetical protein C8R42DRAFT_642144 [Lentinula raphanica]
MSNVAFPLYSSETRTPDFPPTLKTPVYRTPTKPKRSTRLMVSSPYTDQFSPEYTTAMQQSGFDHMPGLAVNEDNAIAKDVERALRARERARSRKLTPESIPRSRRMVTTPAQSVKAQEFPPSHSNKGLISAHATATPLDFQGECKPTTSERLRMRSFRFPRVKDSISLPYLQNRPRNAPRISNQRIPAVGNGPPPVPSLLSSRPTYSSPVLTCADGSPKCIAPLPRFDPFTRPRADSLSSLVETRNVSNLGIPPMRCGPATVRASRLRRVPTMNDLFSNINRQAGTNVKFEVTRLRTFYIPCGIRSLVLSDSVLLPTGGFWKSSTRMTSISEYQQLSKFDISSEEGSRDRDNFANSAPLRLAYLCEASLFPERERVAPWQR